MSTTPLKDFDSNGSLHSHPDRKRMSRVAIPHGGGSMGPQVAIQKQVSTGPNGKRQRKLTAREEDIVELVASGGTNKRIAAQLGISPFTVAIHLRNIYSKLGVHRRPAMVATVMGEGLLTIDSHSV